MSPFPRSRSAEVLSRGPLFVLLLPGMLERLPDREPIEALLRAPSAVAVEPARVSYGALAVATLTLPVTARLWTRMESRGIESGRLGSERMSS